MELPRVHGYSNQNGEKKEKVKMNSFSSLMFYVNANPILLLSGM
jgi:hypothetical protein